MGRYSRVGVNQLCHDTAECLDTERQRSDIQKEDILHVTGEDTTLDGGAYSDDLVRIDALVRLLSEEVLDKLLDFRNTS